MKECLTGESVTFKGDFYECSRFRLGVRLGDRRPKVIVGALNPAMLRLAGEVADGVLLNYLPASHVPWSVEQVREGKPPQGRHTTSRSTATCTSGWASGTTASSSPAATCSATRSSTPTPPTSSGRASATTSPRSAQRHDAGDREGALAAVSDAMVDAIDVMGDADHVHATVQAYVDAGVQVPVIMPLPWGPDRMAVVDATMRAGIGAG